jgi:hypothetical protein
MDKKLRSLRNSFAPSTPFSRFCFKIYIFFSLGHSIFASDFYELTIFIILENHLVNDADERFFPNDRHYDQ